VIPNMTPNDQNSISPTGCSKVSRRGRHLKRGETPVGEHRRAEILAFAERHIREHGYVPTHKKICEQLFIDKSTLCYHMNILRKSGAIIGPGNGAHSWTLPKFAAACRAVE
jgi:SOS-response transcriptional repressor LexA